MIFSGGTITPKSMISKLLQAKTTATIFLPISCTSPLTVAINTFPAPPAPEGGATKFAVIVLTTLSSSNKTC